MKKIMTKVLVFALVLTGISVLSSCKDYDEDKYSEIEILMGDRFKTLDELKKELEALKAECEANRCKCDGSGNCNCSGNGCSCDGSGNCGCTPNECTCDLSNFVTNDQLTTDLNNLEDKLNDAIEDAQKAAEEAAATQDEELKKEIMDSVDESIKEIKDELESLKKRVEALENALANLVTGILVQGTENPVFGTFALPANISSNVLMAFYGESSDYIEFPTYKNGDAAGNYIWAAQALTQKEWDMINFNEDDLFTEKGGVTLISDEADNAGKLYLTVNPAEVNFAGLKVEIENSQAKSAGVEVSPLKVSDKTLTFGYTRAAGNGFYEADVKVSDPEAVQKVNLDAAGFKAIAKDLVTDVKHFDYVTAGQTVYNQFSGMLDANAVKAQYKGLDGDRTVYSNYVLAATAVKPLSYAFAKDFAGRSKLPGYERVANVIERTVKAIKNRISGVVPTLDPLELTLNGLTFDYTPGDLNKSFSFSFSMQVKAEKEGCPEGFVGAVEGTPTFDPNAEGCPNTIACNIIDGAFEDGTPIQFFCMWSRVPADVEVNDNTEGGYDSEITYKWAETLRMRLNDEDAIVENAGDGTFNLKITKTDSVDLTQDIQDVVDEIEKAFNEVGDTFDSIEDFIAQVNDMIAQINNIENNITSVTAPIEEKIKAYLDKLNNLGVKVINSAIARLQPCLIVATEKGAKLGVNTPSYPSVVESTNVTLVPTSFTYEILTPAFKKHVACVNVLKGGKSAQGGDNDCQTELKNVNGQTDMNVVLEGSATEIPVTLKSGYTYVFAYSALDYSGKICTKRAAVRVK